MIVRINFKNLETPVNNHPSRASSHRFPAVDPGAATGGLSRRSLLQGGAGVLLALGISPALTACAGGGQGAVTTGLPGLPERSAPLRRDHPLAGRLWLTAERRESTAAELAQRLAAARWCLLGETHDNPDHHRLQAWCLAVIAAAARQAGRPRPGVAWEMIDEAQAPALTAALAAADTGQMDAAGLGPALGWAETGWPDWALYQPVAAAALAAGLPMRAGGLSRATTRRIAREGLAAVWSPAELEALALTLPLPQPVQDGQTAELVTGHCGLMPQAMLAPMLSIQTAKDAVMARAMRQVSADTGGGAGVLIAGSGHARRDLGVPLHLLRQGETGPALVVTGVEVQDGGTDPTAYELADPARADVVWFTGAAEREDPCEGLKARSG